MIKFKIKAKHKDITDHPVFNTLKNNGIKSPYMLGLIVGHILKNEKIQAVKLIKEQTGLGLKESKDIMDKLIDDMDNIHRL